MGSTLTRTAKCWIWIDDCISCGVDKLIDEAGGPVWTEEGFSQLHR
ncbi:hypothetical protein LNQ03_00435 [Klebsiella pneumoniae subsp. pneumoniae]|nr:hypothetical protein [Klebsiella pneumoniae subsp. pneumoniae]